nr:hypothetical protein [Coxiella-like endosymbiont]
MHDIARKNRAKDDPIAIIRNQKIFPTLGRNY